MIGTPVALCASAGGAAKLGDAKLDDLCAFIASQSGAGLMCALHAPMADTDVQRAAYKTRRRNASNMRRYCIKRETCEEVASALGDRGMQADAYHAGLSTRVREQVQSEWLASDSGVVVSTTVRSARSSCTHAPAFCLSVLRKTLWSTAVRTGVHRREGVCARVCV